MKLACPNCGHKIDVSGEQKPSMSGLDGYSCPMCGGRSRLKGSLAFLIFGLPLVLVLAYALIELSIVVLLPGIAASLPLIGEWLPAAITALIGIVVYRRYFRLEKH